MSNTRVGWGGMERGERERERDRERWGEKSEREGEMLEMSE